MTPPWQSSAETSLTTAAVVDACVRLGEPVRLAPPGLRPVLVGAPFAGRARPVTHRGSVDVILIAINDSQAGDVLIIDDGGRTTEACVGDLVALEAHQAGLAGAVIWGSHRDTTQLHLIGFPVVSLGPCPSGPRGLEPPASGPTGAAWRQLGIAGADLVVADDDGVVLLGERRRDDVLTEAMRIQAVEAQQASALRNGTSLRQQLDLAGYLSRRSSDPNHTFRRHLTELGAAIET
jgi:regulator of RNase E activity RraA